VNRRQVVAGAVLVACGALAWINWHRLHPAHPAPADMADAGAPAAPSSPAPSSVAPPSAPAITPGSPQAIAPNRATHPLHDLPPFALPAGKLAAVLPDLKATAERGDANAAYAVYALLRDCAQQDTLASTLDTITRSSPADSPIVASLQQQVAATALRCEGVAKPTIADRQPWLDRAAAGGNPYARASYANDALAMLREDPDWMLRNSDDIARIKTAGADYLQQSANDGDRSAMIALGMFYGEDILLPRNPELAYAYLYAATNYGTLPGSQALVAQHASQLTPQQLSHAQILAHQIHGP
jgi:hypothetical protein